MNITHKTNAQLVDELGALKAQKADIASREKSIKALLLTRSGHPFALENTFEGSLFRAVFSTHDRETLDTKAVRAIFKATGADLPLIYGQTKRWDVKARTESREAA